MKAIYTTSNAIAPEMYIVWFDKIKNEELVYFSTQTQLMKLRLEHLLGSINIEFVEIYKDLIHIDKDGNFDYFPPDFFDETFNLTLQVGKELKKLKLGETK